MTSNASLISYLNNTQSSYKTASSSSSSSASSMNDVQNTFLKLLTTQLQNQDPTNPLDNAQLTTQLAQISTAQGMNDLNTTLTSLMGAYQSSQTLQAASLVGHQVMAEGSKIALSNSQGLGGVDLASAADAVTVTIQDASGNTVKTLNLGAQSAGQVGFSWDGTDATGNTVADGNYTFSVKAASNGSDVTATPLALSTVSSVSVNNGTLGVNVAGLGQLNLNQIYRIF